MNEEAKKPEEEKPREEKPKEEKAKKEEKPKEEKPKEAEAEKKEIPAEKKEQAAPPKKKKKINRLKLNELEKTIQEAQQKMGGLNSSFARQLLKMKEQLLNPKSGGDNAN